MHYKGRHRKKKGQVSHRNNFGLHRVEWAKRRCGRTSHFFFSSVFFFFSFCFSSSPALLIHTTDKNMCYIHPFSVYSPPLLLFLGFVYIASLPRSVVSTHYRTRTLKKKKKNMHTHTHLLLPHSVEQQQQQQQDTAETHTHIHTAPQTASSPPVVQFSSTYQRSTLTATPITVNEALFSLSSSFFLS